MLDLFHDRVAVGVAIGERDQHVEHRRRQGEQITRVASHMTRDDTSCRVILSTAVFPQTLGFRIVIGSVPFGVMLLDRWFGHDIGSAR